MNEVWTPSEILGAVGMNPATCDNVYQSAAAVLWHLQTGEPATVDLRWSKGSLRTVEYCVQKWACELDIQFQSVEGGMFPMRRSGSWGLRRQPKPGSPYPRRKVWDVVSAFEVTAPYRFCAINQGELFG